MGAAAKPRHCAVAVMLLFATASACTNSDVQKKWNGTTYYECLKTDSGSATFLHFELQSVQNDKYGVSFAVADPVDADKPYDNVLSPWKHFEKASNFSDSFSHKFDGVTFTEDELKAFNRIKVVHVAKLTCYKPGMGTQCEVSIKRLDQGNKRLYSVQPTADGTMGTAQFYAIQTVVLLASACGLTAAGAVVAVRFARRGLLGEPDALLLEQGERSDSSQRECAEGADPMEQ